MLPMLMTAFLSLQAAVTHADKSAGPDEFKFSVWFNDKPIGNHEFSVATRDGTTNVTSMANFVVKMLFVPVYQYEHEALEIWNGNCLTSLTSTTLDSGKQYQVNLRKDQLANLGSGDCAASFAYWDRDKLNQSQLLNSQTGTLSDLLLTYEGPDAYHGVDAKRYRLAVDDNQVITLWYRQSDDRWIGLETKRDRGTLQYMAEKL
jgi:hypothetical protein